PTIWISRAFAARGNSSTSVSTRAWLSPTSASKSYGTPNSFVEGGAAAGGLAGGGALSNASRPLLGRGGRGGSNVKLYRPSAGRLVLHDASGSVTPSLL